MKRTDTRVPPLQASTGLRRLERLLFDTAFPLYWLRARHYGLPGLRFASDSARLALRSLIGKHDGVPLSEIYRMLILPVESTRYFEFGLAWDYISDMSIGRYLDVSSPRLFPLALMARRRETTADLINPDPRDLNITAGMVRACGLAERCTLSNTLVEETPLRPSTFDLITSLSVVEHIPAGKAALQRMWGLLKPGGRLVLSVPCAAVGEEQYIDANQFGLQRPDKDGFFFLQYVYDEASLDEHFYSVLGRPTRHGIYGEKEPGSLRRGLIKKWSGAKYARWREPYTMAQDFQRYSTVGELPGEGVIVMQFDKR